MAAPTPTPSPVATALHRFSTTSSSLKDDRHSRLLSSSSPRVASGLSPSALPFHPGGSSVGRSKLRQWPDEDDDLLSDGNPASVASPSASPAIVHLVDVYMLALLQLENSTWARLMSILVRTGDGDPPAGVCGG